MSDQPGPPIIVRHNAAEHRFETQVDGYLAFAEYERDGSHLTMTHTFVPPELRGRGIAEKLVRPALEYARKEGLTVVPACSYVAVFMQRHPEYRDLLE